MNISLDLGDGRGTLDNADSLQFFSFLQRHTYPDVPA